MLQSLIWTYVIVLWLDNSHGELFLYNIWWVFLWLEIIIHNWRTINVFGPELFHYGPFSCLSETKLISKDFLGQPVFINFTYYFLLVRGHDHLEVVVTSPHVNSVCNLRSFVRVSTIYIVLVTSYVTNWQFSFVLIFTPPIKMTTTIKMKYRRKYS